MKLLHRLILWQFVGSFVVNTLFYSVGISKNGFWSDVFGTFFVLIVISVVTIIFDFYFQLRKGRGLSFREFLKEFWLL